MEENLPTYDLLMILLYSQHSSATTTTASRPHKLQKIGKPRYLLHKNKNSEQ